MTEDGKAFTEHLTCERCGGEWYRLVHITSSGFVRNRSSWRSNLPADFPRRPGSGQLTMADRNQIALALTQHIAELTKEGEKKSTRRKSRASAT